MYLLPNIFCQRYSGRVTTTQQLLPNNRYLIPDTSSIIPYSLYTILKI